MSIGGHGIGHGHATAANKRGLVSWVWYHPSSGKLKALSRERHIGCAIDAGTEM